LPELSEISENSIRSLEQAMRAFGVDGVTVDGNSEDITPARLVPFLNKLSMALGSTGTDFGQGREFTSADFYDPEILEHRINEISTAVEGFQNSPHLALVREIYADSPDYSAIEAHLTEMDIDDPAGKTQMIRKGMVVGPETLLHDGIPFVSEGIIPTAEAQDPNFAKLREILGDQAIDNIEQTIAVMDASDEWMDVVDALQPDAPTEAVSEADVASGAAALEAEIEVMQASENEVKTERIKAVESVLGIETPDGVWGDEERADLKEYIAEMQAEDPTWIGHKDGVYTEEYARYVRGDLSVNGDFTTEQRAFFEQLADLRNDNVDLVAEADEHATHEDVQGAILVVEEALERMIPLVQGELDTKRAEAEGLIDSINGRAASELQREAAERVLADPNSPDEHKVEAQDVLDQSNLGNNIGEFLDGFIGLGYTDFGHNLVQTGKRWSTDMIRGQLAGIQDLPPVESINSGDGRLDLNEQTALQGITTLLAKKFNIGGEDNWHYTPELGEKLLAGFESMDDADKLLLLDEEALADYNGQADDAAKKTFLDRHFEEEKKSIEGLLVAMDLLYENGVLLPQRLYDFEEVEIPPFTKEIFGDFIEDNQTNPAQLNMLNLYVYEFTEGVDLTMVMGEDYDLPTGIDPIDPTKTIAQRFAERYEDGLDPEHMVEMLETLPFGTDARRGEMKNVAQSAADAVRKAKEEDPSITDDMIAILYGNAMESGLNAMNDNAAMGSDYLFISQRPITMDPRLSETISPDSDISVEEVFALHKRENRDFTTEHYKPMFFKDENGVTYIAARDYLSNVFTIQELDLDHWDQVVRDTPKLPGEAQRVYDIRLDEALSEVSGHDLIFQNNFEEHQTTLIRGTNAIKITSLLRERNIGSFDDVENRVNTDYDIEKAQIDAEIARFKREAGTPESAQEVFREASQARANGTAHDPLSEFGATADQITTPSDGDGTPPSLGPGDRVPSLRVGAPLSIRN